MLFLVTIQVVTPVSLPPECIDLEACCRFNAVYPLLCDGFASEVLLVTGSLLLLGLISKWCSQVWSLPLEGHNLPHQWLCTVTDIATLQQRLQKWFHLLMHAIVSTQPESQSLCWSHL